MGKPECRVKVERGQELRIERGGRE
jgi:hypothetical protein